MGNGHLGDRVAALVDDELAHSARERVLSHITTCEDCRADVEAARALKRRLAALSTPRPNVEPSADLLLALLELGKSKPPEPPSGIPPMRDEPQPSWFGVESPRIDPHGTTQRRLGDRMRLERAATGHPTAHPRPLARRPLRVRAVTMGAVSMAAATLGSAVVLGVGGAASGAGMTSGSAQHALYGRAARRDTSGAATLSDIIGTRDHLPLSGDAPSLVGIPLALPATTTTSTGTPRLGGVEARPAGATTSAVTNAETSRSFGTGGLAPSSFGASSPFGMPGGFIALP